jgi:hypothetical protein
LMTKATANSTPTMRPTTDVAMTARTDGIGIPPDLAALESLAALY